MAEKDKPFYRLQSPEQIYHQYGAMPQLRGEDGFGGEINDG